MDRVEFSARDGVEQVERGVDFVRVPGVDDRARRAVRSQDPRARGQRTGAREIECAGAMTRDGLRGQTFGAYDACGQAGAARREGAFGWRGGEAGESKHDVLGTARWFARAENERES